jgi:arabinofuranosyltransferase
VRSDVLPLMLFVFAFIVLMTRRRRHRVVAGLLVVALVVSAHLMWRHHFYGQWLPNTYYLKATGWPLTNRIIPGLKHGVWTAATLGFPFLLALVGLLVRPRFWHFLLLGVFATTVAYQVYMGGDAWPLSRFVIPSALGLFALAGDGIHQMMTLFMQDKTRLSGTVFRAALTLLAVAAVNAVHWDHCLLIAPPQTTRLNLMNIRCVLAVQKIADPDASVAVGCAGAFPYFSQRACFDFLGVCDPWVARLPAHPEIRQAGHNKYDWTYTLSAHRPDVILHAVRTDFPAFRREYQPIAVEVDGTEVSFCVRRGSLKVRGGRIVNWRTVDRYLKRVRAAE